MPCQRKEGCRRASPTAFKMVFNNIKKSLASLILAASILSAPASAKAYEEKQLLPNAPGHIQWILDNKDSAKAFVLGANMVFNCLKSGVGSYFNDKGFLGGCAKGAFAGSISYAGAYIATFNDVPMLGATGKLVNDLGISISDNVMRGENMLSQYQTELGPVTLTFRDSIIPSPSFTLTPAVAIVKDLAGGQVFDARNSLYNLTPVFYMPLERNGWYSGKGMVAGYSNGNVISYTPIDYVGNLTLSHEFNHSLFWSKMRFCGDFMPGPLATDGAVGKWWNIGQDLCFQALAAPSNFQATYYYGPLELEAHIMQRK